MDPGTSLPASAAQEGGQALEETRVLTVLFDDMKGSTELKERLAETSDEEAYQRLRKEHDATVTEAVTRGGAGRVIKSTGDGLLAVFERPSLAVERAVEIQERFHAHPHIKVRIGIDMGEVRIETAEGRIHDVFGRHVDWAARAMALAREGHICVTRSVYLDAFSWIVKSRIAWKEHGSYRLKPGDPALALYEPYNANLTIPQEDLGGAKAVPGEGTSVRSGAAAPVGAPLRIVRSWESVARDGRDFAENGSGMMYWFRVPLGGICYPEGFRNFLQPALANPKITKIRFAHDATVPAIRKYWEDLVLPLVREWITSQGLTVEERVDEHNGFVHAEGSPDKGVSWVYVDLSREFVPCFKLIVHDPDTNEPVRDEVQIFLSTAQRTVRSKTGATETIRIPDAILRVGAKDEPALLHAMNSVANQWDSLFP